MSIFKFHARKPLHKVQLTPSIHTENPRELALFKAGLTYIFTKKLTREKPAGKAATKKVHFLQVLKHNSNQHRHASAKAKQRFKC